MKSKKQKVFEHLQRHGTINPLQALNLFHAMRLADIVFRLKKDGHDIETKLIRTADSHFAEYSYHSNSDNKSFEPAPIEKNIAPVAITGKPLTFNIPVNENITFIMNGEKCGRLYLKNKKLCFAGDLDLSAELLFKQVANLFNKN